MSKETFELRLMDPDNFSGVTSLDLEDLAHFSHQLTESQQQRVGCVTNFLGVLTAGSNHPYLDIAGRRFANN